jgi:phage shock protein PspC (stress-responsive transcriptional regulator)
MHMPRRLYRSRTERWIAGVCGGLSAYLDVDLSALRLGFAVMTLWHGFGLLLYLLLVVIVPEEPLRQVANAPGFPLPEPEEEEHHRRARTLGTILVFGGAYLLLQQARLFEVLIQQSWVGVVLIVGGLLVLILRSARKM